MTNDCAVGHLLFFYKELQMVVRTSMILLSTVRSISAGMLSIPGDLQIFSELAAVSISCMRIGSCGSLISLITFSTAMSPVTGWMYSPSTHYCASSVIPFPSWSVMTFPFLSVVRSLTTSLLLCVIKLFSISQHFLFTLVS